MKKKFTIYRQLESMDCGPTCLRMIARHYGKSFSLDYIKEISSFSRTGMSLQSIMDAGDTLGIESMAVKISPEELFRDAPLPCILHWNKNHFVVLPPQNITPGTQKIKIADPESGMRNVSREAFLDHWARGQNEGIALLMHPTGNFYDITEMPQINGFSFLKKYVSQYRSTLIKVALTLLVTSGLTLVFPLLTQALVDEGIASKDKNFVLLILLAQVALFFGNIIMDIARSWWLLYMNTRINITIVSDFLLKLMKLPLRFFDARRVGDIQQRILDHTRIEQLLSGNTLSVLFSFVNLLVFSIVLAIYNVWLLVIFILMSALSLIWIFLFLNRRKQLDLVQFALNSKNQNMLNEMVVGMPEIKLNTAEEWQQKSWETIQMDLYRRNIQSLRLAQYQQTGSAFFTQLKNIIITFFSALLVINGDMTLGMMLAVSFIIGQMNAPLDQLLNIIELGQDAKLSLERLGEVHNRPEERTHDDDTPAAFPRGDIRISDLGFGYDRDEVLSDISCTIPSGKVTAIVGTSGSGKTTLLKLLLQFYNPSRGQILLGEQVFGEISLKHWREKTGVVMQDGFIFSDTIEKNITMGKGDEEPGNKKLLRAIHLSNLDELVSKFPSGIHTMIGINGTGLSMGQKQRILIARAIYKDPEFIFFDEATSALDARNEKEIMNKLREFYRGKTVVVAAHRLSTVKHADHILVLDNGRLVESGTHAELTGSKGKYYELVKNQLELGL